jgi:hypothetical protein
VSTLLRLGEALTTAGVKYTGLSLLQPGQTEEPGWFVTTGPLGEKVRIDGVPIAEQVAATAVVLGFDFSQIAHDTWLALKARTADAEGLTGTVGTPRVLRAVVSLTVDELNDLRTWTRNFKAATAAATSLADLKVRVAALANLSDRTLVQARTAIVNKIEQGEVD